jgi:hypothetical protein
MKSERGVESQQLHDTGTPIAGADTDAYYQTESSLASCKTSPMLRCPYFDTLVRENWTVPQHVERTVPT